MKLSPRLTSPIRWPLSSQIILVLAFALLPLGILAVLAAADNYRDFRRSQAALATTRIEYLRRAATAGLDQEFAILQAMLLAGDTSPAIRQGCDRQFTRLARIDPIIDSLERLDARGTLLCASTGSALRSRMPSTRSRSRELSSCRMARGQRVRRASASAGRGGLSGDGSAEAGAGPSRVPRAARRAGSGDTILARVRRAEATRLLDAAALRGNEHVRLVRYGETMASWSGRHPINPLAEVDIGTLGAVQRVEASDGDQWFVGAVPLGPSGLRLALAHPADELSVSQALNIALPMVMWLVALAIGWAAIDWLVVRPLTRMRRGVDLYAEDPTVRLDGSGGRSFEIRQLGMAFDRMADRLDTHEDDLRDALVT